MECKKERTGLLSASDINYLVSNHDTDFIYGLDYAKQRQIVATISEGLYKEGLKDRKITSDKVINEVLSTINNKIDKLNTSISKLEAVNTKGRFDKNISVLKENLADNVAARENIGKLALIAYDFLSKLDVRIKKLDAFVDETNKDTEEETESGLERTAFSDTYSLELNSRNTASTRLKEFLAFVDDYRFEGDELIKKESFFGSAIPLNFQYVYKELHRILEGIESTEEAILTRLNNESDKVKNTKNNNLAWLPSFITYFNEAPKQIRREFVSDMAKHKVDMRFVMYKSEVEPKTLSEIIKLRVYEDNSSSTTRRIQETWKKAHKTSNIVVDGSYSEEIKFKLLEDLAQIRKIEDGKTQAKDTLTWLKSLGILSNSEFIKSLFTSGNRLYYGKDKSANGKALIAKNGVLETLLKSIIPGQNVDNSDFINDSIVKGFAYGSSQFTRDEFDNAFRVGEKLIYTYSNNQYVVNRIRDLKKDKDLMDSLDKAQFSKDSLYLNLLKDEDSDLDFLNWFDLGYVSLNPIKINKGRRSEKITSISPLDMEVTKIGMFNSQRSFKDVEISGITHKIRKSQFFFPTNSDKSRIMMVNGSAVDPVETITVNGAKQLRFKKSSIQLFIDSVVRPEIDRIYNTVQSGFVDNNNLSTYNGGLFYLLPELNSFIIADENTGEERLFLDIVKESPELETEVEKQLLIKIHQILSEQVKDKIEAWKRLGIIKTNDNGVETVEYIELIKDGNKLNRDVNTTAYDYVYNYMLSNANMFQLTIGDPSQYFKSKSDNPIQQVYDTYDNIGKRLAAEIAPGIEMEGSDYIQLYANDRESMSTQFESILQTLDDTTIDEYNNLTKQEQRKLKSYPYSEIEGTDAQEYTTWKEHLNILLYLGKINNEEHAEASKAFSEGKNPTKKVFNEVLQPMKPVYVDNNPNYTVGDITLDKKTYIKSSSFPLIPTLTKGLEIDKVRQKLESLEKSSGKGVRLAFKTSTKVGFPKNAVDLFDANGNVVDFSIDNYEVLNRDGLRIQQDIPYDTKVSEIKSGSQEKKLMWANIGNIKFNYEDKIISGKDLHQIYIDTYKQLYVKGLNKLQFRINDADGVLDVQMVSDMLKQELKRRGENSKPLLDGLDIEESSKVDPKTNELKTVKDFRTPLWISPYSDKYMALLTSIVKNGIVSHKLTGKSFVLGSNEGFKVFSSVEEAGETGTIFTNSYTGELQPQHVDAEGVVQPAQIIIPFKFRDSNGNLLSVDKFTTKDNTGRIIIDNEKLPKDLLKSFGFRIPTQLHSNMSYMEIVGFLPTTSGDLIIAPREFTKQMGSDFDVDKLYTYLYHPTYNSGLGTLSKTVEIRNYQPRINEFVSLLNTARRELDSSEIYSFINNLIAEYEDIGNVINLSAFVDLVVTKFPDINKSVVSDIISAKLNIKRLDDNYVGGIHNKLLDIHMSVMSNKDIQKSVLTPLDFGQYLNLATVIDGFNSKYEDKFKSILTDSYQTDKFYDGTAGKDGISVFSSDSVFNALAQDKDLIIQDTEYDSNGKPHFVPISVEFGNKYNKSNGNLSKIMSQKIVGAKPKTEVIAAAQNLSVDNANEQGMFKVNMNTYTFATYSVLNFLGFEEDISAPFMSQPILVEYAEKMRERNSILKPYSIDGEEEIVKELRTKYLNGEEFIEEDQNLADFKSKDATKELLNLIDLRENYPDFNKYQVSILDKFLKLKSYESNIAPIKQLLNIDSKGFDKSMYVNRKKLDFLEGLETSNIANADKLIGEYTPILNNGFVERILINPTTLAGLDNMLGTKTLINTFSDFFLESNTYLRFDSIINSVGNIISDSGKLSFKTIYKIKEDYKSYLMSNFNVDSVNNLRRNLYTRKDENSLYNDLMKLKNTGYWVNNRFLSSLDISTVDNVLSIDFNNVNGDSFDDTNLYLSLIDLFRQNGKINGVIPSIVAEELIQYSLLRGNKRAKQFVKYIPTEILNKFITFPNYVKETDNFIDQWVRHNAEETPTLDKFKEVSQAVVRPTDGKIYPEYVNVRSIKKGKRILKLYKSIGDNKYRLINQLGSNEFTEYSVEPVEESISDKNNLIKIVPAKNLPNKEVNKTEGLEQDGVDTYNNINQSTTNKVSVNKLSDKLNLDSASELLQSIMELEDFPQYSNLAKAIKNQVPKDLTIKLVSGLKLGFSYSPNTVIIGNETLQELSNNELLSGIMHEFMHSVTAFNINEYLNNTLNPGIVKKAIVDLNKYKNEVISKLTEEQETILRNVSIKYFNSVDINKLTTLLNDTTIHSKIYSWLKQVYEYKQDPTVDIDGTIKQSIDESNNIEYDKDVYTAYYSLLNLKEFVAVSSTNDNARTMFDSITGVGYLGKIREFFVALLESLGITSKSEQALIDDILKIAEIKVDLKIEKILDSIVVENTEEKALFKSSDGNTYFMEEDKIYNISLPTKPVFENVELRKRSFINEYINSVSSKIVYSENEFNDDVYRPFILDGLYYTKVSELANQEARLESFKQNPKSIAKLFKFKNDNPNSIKYEDLYNQLKKDFDYNETSVQDVKEPVYKEYSKYHLPEKVDNPVVVDEKYQQVVDYSNQMIGHGSTSSITGKLATPFKTNIDSILSSLENEGEEVKNNCKGKSSKKAEKGFKTTLKSGGNWKVLKDLKGFPSHSNGGVDLKVMGGKISFTGKNGTIEAKYGMFIPKDLKVKKRRSQELISGKTWDQLFNYRNSTNYAEFGAVIPRKNKNYYKALSKSEWNPIEFKNSSMYASNGLLLPRQKKNTDFTKGNVWDLVKDLKGKPSHNQGGFDIFVNDNGKTSFSTEEGKKIHAKCGLVIKSKR